MWLVCSSTQVIRTNQYSGFMTWGFKVLSYLLIRSLNLLNLLEYILNSLVFSETWILMVKTFTFSCFSHHVMNQNCEPL